MRFEVAKPTFDMEEYVKLACKARDRCFNGATLRGNVAYEVGEVTAEGHDGRDGSERVHAKCSAFASALAG